MSPNPFLIFSNLPAVWNYTISVIGISAGIIFMAMSKEEYRVYVQRWIAPRQSRHQLTYEEIFENEYRLSIIDCILKQPGIHYNEILRQCNLHAGQCRWHLDVLLSYGIIKSKPVGQYVLYYPVNKSNPLKEEDLTVVKSERTLQILNVIRFSPGITASKVAEALNLKRNSVKYHVDKLLERKIITFKVKGRNKLLYYNKTNDLIKEFENFLGSSIFSSEFNTKE